MSKSYPYARFQNLLFLARSQSNEMTPEDHFEILTFISEMNGIGKQVTMTDLAMSMRFGTPPTVHRKVNLLNKNSYITSEVSNADKRVKALVLTDKARQLLVQRSDLLIKVAREHN